MSIAVTVRKLLWGRAGNRCAYQGCNQLLTMDLHDAETKVLASSGAVLGEEAHIRSGRPGGPRHDPLYLDVDGYANLVLLCPTHHAIVDKDGGAAWSVGALEARKAEHEALVQAALDPSQQLAQQLAERVAASIELWAAELLDEWGPMTFALLQPYPSITTERFQRLLDRGTWLLAKDWPSSMPRLQAAFDRWGSTLSALNRHINDEFEAGRPGDHDDVLELPRRHKQLRRWDPPAHAALFDEFLRNCVVTWWLVVELTRATNLVITAVRDELDPLYRFDEGVVLLHDGDIIFGLKVARHEFDNPDWSTVARGPTLEGIREALDDEKSSRGFDRYDDINFFEFEVAPPSH